MADKNIGSLPVAAALDDDSLLIAEQQGEAVHFRGQMLKKYAADAGREAAEHIKQGPPGEDFKILGYFKTLSDLETAVPRPDAGDAYGVGASAPYDIYVYDGVGLDWVNNGSIQGPEGPEGKQGKPFVYEDFTPEQLKALTGPAGEDGADGSSIQSIVRTAGNGAPGTTDTYTVALTDGSKTTFHVYNGKDGEGAGDMTARVYDPTGKAQDIFKYVDDKLKDIDVDVTADEVTFADGETFQQKYDSGELTGPIGKDGDPGPAGADGAPAKINGVNTLTITTDEYLSMEQTGSTLKLGLQSAPSSLGANTYALTVSGWSDNGDGRFKQTISVPGVTTDASQVIMVDAALTGTDLDADAATLGAWGPDDGSGPSSQNVAQGSGTLTFYCTVVPTVNIPVFVGVG